MIISDDFFMDYYYAMDDQAESTGATKNTEFYNPETLVNTLWLHTWRIFSTSPFANCIVFTKDASAVSSVTVSPSTANVTPGQQLQFSASVATTGITNQAVQWTVDSSAAADDVTINASGLLSVPSDASVESITVTATSIYDKTKSGTASVTVGSGGSGGDVDVESNITSISVSPTSMDITAAGTYYFSCSVIATGEATTGVEWSIDEEAETAGFSINSSTGVLTAPVSISGAIEFEVTATSTFDDTMSDSATVSADY